MQIIELEQDTPEWHALRKTKIGASDAPKIMGLSPWGTQYTCWQEKVGVSKASFKSAATQHGKDIEPEARQFFIKETGIYVKPVVGISCERPLMMASYDGLSEDGRIALETKSPIREDGEDHQLALKGIVPDKYIYQLQHQMYVDELDQIYYQSYHVKSKNIFVVKRDQKMIDNMLREEEKFWEYVMMVLPPPLTEREKEKERAPVLVSDKIFLELAAELQECNKYADRREEIRKTLITMSTQYGDIVEGGGIRITRRMEKGRVKYDSIPELRNVDLDKYRSEPIVKHVIGMI